MVPQDSARLGYSVMIYGISGASGVGKTTVAELVADALDIEFVRASITEGAKRHGYNAVGNLSLSERFDLQKKLLVDHINLIQGINRPVILDRTPIDMIGYMMGEIHMSSYSQLSENDMRGISSYVDKCQSVAANQYDFIFHLCPLPFYEQAATRPASNPAYQRHTDLIMRGAMQDIPNFNGAILNTTDLNDRQSFIHDTIVARLDALQELRERNPSIH